MSEEQLSKTSASNPAPVPEALLSQLETLKLSNNLPAYISLLEQVLQLVPRENDPLAWAALQFALGNALQQNEEGDRKAQLADAIACHDAALTVYTREQAPANWAAVQQYKRSALCDLVELQSGTKHLETLRAIVACCDAILTVCTREATPTNW